MGRKIPYQSLIKQDRIRASDLELHYHAPRAIEPIFAFRSNIIAPLVRPIWTPNMTIDYTCVQERKLSISGRHGLNSQTMHSSLRAGMVGDATISAFAFGELQIFIVLWKSTMDILFEDGLGIDFLELGLEITKSLAAAV